MPSFDEKTPETSESAAAAMLGDADDSDSGPAAKKGRVSYEESRRKEIRETNRLAARECRARKKRLMSELEKTVASLTAEHSALMKQNRELSIRLETLQRTAAMGFGPMPGAAAGMNPNLLGGNAMGNAMGLLPGLNASLQSSQPVALPGGQGAAGSAGSGGNIVVQHMHHYDGSNEKSVPGHPSHPGPGAPPTAAADLKTTLGKLGYLNQTLQNGSTSTAC